MQRDVTSGPAARLRRSEAPLPQLGGLTGIDGGAVYLNQIRLNPSLALRCSGDLLRCFIGLKLSLK